MAEEKNPKDPAANDPAPKNPAANGPVPEGAGDWVDVNTDYQRGDSLLTGPYVKVSRKGFVQASVEATILAEQAAQARGYTRHGWVWAYKANLTLNQVGCIPIPAGKAKRGAGAIRFYTGKGSARATWHLGGVFKQYPQLAPRSDVKCVVAVEPGPDGLPMLVVPIKVAMGTHTTARESGGSTPGNQTAAGEDPTATNPSGDQ